MKGQIAEWGKAILRAALILLALFYFCWPVRISGSSMEPALHDGEIVLMSRALVLAGQLGRGDIVTFQYHGEGGGNTLVKRIAALPGEHIRILPDGAGVEVDGAVLAEPYAQGRTDGLADMEIPEKAFFLLGDNRETSYDSRNIGTVPQGDLKGRVFFRVYPFSEFGRL